MNHLIRVIVATILLSLNTLTQAADCPKGELRFAFKNLEVKMAFAIFADFAGLKPVIDKSITHSSPMNFDCTPWEVAARNPADKYSLALKIESGTMYVSRN